MKVTVVNIPKIYREKIDLLVNEEGLYSGRSELIRCALREFFIQVYGINNKNTIIRSDVVSIPFQYEDDQGNIINAFKTHKVIRRLESAP
jgi:metal-responsive CopG/Arc/MetJ family transcriptional regulator